MKKKDIKLFNKAIHEVKKVITEISKENKKYHKESLKKDKIRIIRRKRYDKAINKQIKELLGIITELYELFDDLYNRKGDK